MCDCLLDNIKQYKLPLSLIKGKMALEKFVKVYGVIEIYESGIYHDYPVRGEHEAANTEETSRGFYAHRELALAAIENLKEQRIQEIPGLVYSKFHLALVPPLASYFIDFRIEEQRMDQEAASEIEIIDD